MANMATYNFELNNRPTKQGTYAVLFRITENKKHKRMRTGVELDKVANWNQKAQKVRSSEPNHQIMNDTLRKIKNEAMLAESSLTEVGKGVTSQSVASAMMTCKRTFSFMEFAEAYAQRTLEAGEYRTYTKYITFLNKLKYFINNVKPEDVLSIPRKGIGQVEFMQKMKRDLMFNEITLSFLNGFKAYLKRIPNTKNPSLTLHPNTISKQFDNFKSLYHKGVVELKDEGLVIKDNPFEIFECATIETYKEKLTWVEIEALRALKLKKKSLLWHTRNCFMLAFYCAGMRAGDLIQLRGTNIRKENEGWRICYRMDKTGSEKNLLLLPEAIEIIRSYVDFRNRTSDYIFPLLSNSAPYAMAETWEQKEQLPYDVKRLLLQHINAKNSLLNRYLCKLAAMAGIDKKLSMHIARHSFANIARQKNASVYDISKSLGHSSIKITESYLSKFDTRSQDATMKQVLCDNYSKEDGLFEQLKKLSNEQLSSLLVRITKENV